MYQTLKYSIDSLIQQLREQGTHSETILNYRIVCNCVLNFYEAEPHSEKEDSLSAFLGRYRSGTEKALENGEISKGYAVFKKRVLRLLGDYAENGWADIKVAPRNRIYSPNELHQEVIIRILDENNLTSSSGYVLDPPI